MRCSSPPSVLQPCLLWSSWRRFYQRSFRWHWPGSWHVCGLALQARRPAAILLYLHSTSLGAVLVSGFWAIVNERFDPRTARSTISHIMVGGSVGGLLGGLLSERVGATLPVTAMLPVLAGIH